LRHRVAQLDEYPVATVHYWATECLPAAFDSSRLVNRDNDPAFGTDFGTAVLQEMASRLLSPRPSNQVGANYNKCTKHSERRPRKR
jgi:hypothetical protein